MLTHTVTGINLQNTAELKEAATEGCTMTSLVENVPSSQSHGTGRE